MAAQLAEVAVIGIDLGKNSCSLAALDGKGAVIKRYRMRPASIATFAKDLPPCIIAMEACCGAHHFGRLLAKQGHQIRLMSPEYVRPTSRRKRMMTGMLKALPKRRPGQRCGSSS
jgi:transposase